MVSFGAGGQINFEQLLSSVNTMGSVSGNIRTGARLHWHNPPTQRSRSESRFSADVGDEEEGGEDNQIPSTTEEMLRSLPRIRVSAHDLEHGHCTECIVCLVKFSKGDPCTRMPCGHLFHEDCLKDWLRNRNQCPVCRYELQNGTREGHGKKTRLPRIRLSDLSMRSAHDLRCLADHIGVNRNGCLEKDELVQRIANSGLVDIAPELQTTPSAKANTENTSIGLTPSTCQPRSQLLPLQPDLGATRPSSAEVRGMGVRELTSVLRRAGLDTCNCLEKSDLVERVLETCRHQPQVRNTSRTNTNQHLSLHTKSIVELKAVAKENGVSLDGCLKRCDVLDRLRSAGLPTEITDQESSIRHMRQVVSGDSLDVLLSGNATHVE